LLALYIGPIQVATSIAKYSTRLCPVISGSQPNNLLALVELHGGTVEAVSEGPGLCATFKVTLQVRSISSALGEVRGAPCAVVSSEEAAMLAGVRVPHQTPEPVRKAVSWKKHKSVNLPQITLSPPSQHPKLLTFNHPRLRLRSYR
jgi:hypothetical protein